MKRKKKPGEAEDQVLMTMYSQLFSWLPVRSSTARRTAGAFVIAAAMIWMALAAAPLIAKKSPPPTKTVRGQVLDGSDSGITGASVEMTDLTTGKKTAIYTQDGGDFLFADLLPTDDYQFQATYHGKQSEVRKVSSWDIRLKMVINLHIPPPKE